MIVLQLPVSFIFAEPEKIFKRLCLTFSYSVGYNGHQSHRYLGRSFTSTWPYWSKNRISCTEWGGMISTEYFRFLKMFLPSLLNSCVGSGHLTSLASIFITGSLGYLENSLAQNEFNERNKSSKNCRIDAWSIWCWSKGNFKLKQCCTK